MANESRPKGLPPRTAHYQPPHRESYRVGDAHPTSSHCAICFQSLNGRRIVRPMIDGRAAMLCTGCADARGVLYLRGGR